VSKNAEQLISESLAAGMPAWHPYTTALAQTLNALAEGATIEHTGLRRQVVYWGVREGAEWRVRLD
jgi:hypothetical protein